MIENGKWRVKQFGIEERAVCLSSSEPGRVWQEVIAEDRDQITELYQDMKRRITEKITWPGFCLMAKFFYPYISQQNERYIKECEYLAHEIGVFTLAQMAFIQVQTTIVTFFSTGCSTVVVWDEELQQMVCMRSLDWSGADMVARSSRIFNLKDESGKPLGKVAGISGMVGCLTAVREGFAVVGNYAPGRPEGMPWNCLKRDDASFLIRQLMEDEGLKTYQQVVDRVKEWDVAAPCFITICGVKKGEACVIEFGRGGKHCQRVVGDDGLLIQTNHYGLKSPFSHQNKKLLGDEHFSLGDEPSLELEKWYCSKLLGNSGKRYNMLKEKLEGSIGGNEDIEEQLEDIFAVPPIMNHDTAQWVLLKPSDGTMKVTAFPEGEGCEK